jgi:methylenetetrahydrofolate reductase (NADPH)
MSWKVHHSNRLIASLPIPPGTAGIVMLAATFYSLRPMKTFREAISERNFVITAECFLKPETDAESIRQQADLLRDHVDAVLLTDNQFGALHMSTIAAARLMLENGMDAIVQLSCRNRNRISLLADLLGAAALGVTSLLLVRGNRIPKDVSSRPKLVLDINAKELITIAASLRTDERLRSIPDLFIGAAAVPHEPKADWVPRKLHAKADAGARFLLTYTCMDIDMLRRFMKRLVATQMTRRMTVVVSIAIFTSAEDAKWLRDNRPNVMIPDSIIHRLESASDPSKEGLRICAEQLAQLAQMPGVSGANIMATTDLAMIPQAIEAADLDEVVL